VDDRFPNWLARILRKLDFVGIPNLGSILAAIAIIAFVANLVNPAGLERIVFDPQLVSEGEWWRILTFFFSGGFRSAISVLFYVLYIYFVINTLESVWGEGPVTVFVILIYAFSMAGAFIVNVPVETSSYLLLNVSLAFGTLFPDYELMLYGILPVKAKWLAGVSVAFALWQFYSGDYVVLPLSVVPYFIFFSHMLYYRTKSRMRVKANRKRFDDDMWR
jgi:hypothetical protein